MRPRDLLLGVGELKVGAEILVTSFLDPKATTWGKIALLFRQAWPFELDLHRIKVVRVAEPWLGSGLPAPAAGR